jgi:hypothetical protein
MYEAIYKSERQKMIPVKAVKESGKVEELRQPDLICCFRRPEQSVMHFPPMAGFIESKNNQ